MADHIDIEHIAQLARLALTDEEKALFTTQMENILQFCKVVDAVDVTGLEPTSHAFPIYNVWQQDEPSATFPVEVALQNAPEKKNNCWVVPKIVEEA